MLQLVAALLFAAAPTPPAPSALLQVSGAVARPGALTLADLEALKPEAATWVDHGDKHQVYGVPLERVLTRAGFQIGEMGKDVPKAEKRRGWRNVVIASAPDGFQAVLSCAEFFASMGATRALIVWKIDGKPLPANRGPLRLVVLTDQEPSRSIYSVSQLEIVDLTRAPKPRD